MALPMHGTRALLQLSKQVQENTNMAYIRSGRAASRNGRPGFVPGAQACAALSRRLTLSTAPTFAPSGTAGRQIAALISSRPAVASNRAAR